SEVLFRNNENYRFFLAKYTQHILPVADTFAWCLIPNHFHFLIRIKSEKAIISHYAQSGKQKPYDPEILSVFIMERFANFFNSYSKAYNKRYNRKGSLFIDYMRRVEILDNRQLLATTFYIHKNPVHHGLTQEITEWKWSSFNSFLTESPTHLQRKTVLEWFGSKNEFEQFHLQPVNLKSAIIIE
ncbi:MAG: hypothetical protein ABI390_00785, partial [Daejeonella sp.]